MNMNHRDILAMCEKEFPDSEEFIGEVYLRLPDIWAAMAPYRSGVARTEACFAQLKAIRSAARNEGRLWGEILSGTMHEFDADDVSAD